MQNQAIMKRYRGYDLNYFLKPGLWMSDEELSNLRKDLALVNHETGKNLNYGIFDSTMSPQDVRYFFSRTNFCVMKLNGKPAGFFYNYILQEKPTPIIHAGLVMISHNAGFNLLTRPYLNMVRLQRKQLGSFYFTNISSTPVIVGLFGDLFTDPWPSHRSSDLVRPARSEYKGIARLLYQNYVLPYFPEKDLELDTRRFVIRSASKEMGFDTNLRNLSRHPSLKANLFCNYWIDYSKGEDLVQVGWVGARSAMRSTLLMFWDDLNLGLSAVKSVLGKKKRTPSRNPTNDIHHSERSHPTVNELPVIPVVEPLKEGSLTQTSDLI